MLLDTLEMTEPKTKEMLGILGNLGLREGTRPSSALILLPARDEAVLRSVHNLPDVRTLVAQYLNVRDLLKFDIILVPLSSLEVIEDILG
jgi:large subunit ribosomal protein L4